MIKIYIDKSLYISQDPYFSLTDDQVIDPLNAGYDLKVCHILDGSIKEGRLLSPDASGEYTLYSGQLYSINTGVKVEIPEGYFGLTSLRSSAAQSGLKIPSPGVIDCSYRGFIWATVYYQNKILYDLPDEYSAAEREHIKYYDDALSIRLPRFSRFMQMMILPYSKQYTIVDTEDALSKTIRGTKGFGEHTGTH